MKCPRCGNETEKGWEYCPKCGRDLRSQEFFSEVFNRINREFREMDKLFESNIEAMDISSFFKKPVKPRGKGFSIRITQRGGKKPDVSVKTFGNVDREKIREELRKVGVKPPEGMNIRKEERKKEPREGLMERSRAIMKSVHGGMGEPKRTEEPETEVRRTESKVIVDIEMPDVKSEDHIVVEDLESSVEVKARAGDKAYFKILTKPANSRLTSKRFEKGVLYLEFS
jgi:HSP20 family molecular chaperone IbpA